MSSVRATNTGPELVVRRRLHADGFRFALHSKLLPGKPDIVLPRFRTIIFVNGCFWHGHHCQRGTLPASNTDFWRAKIIRNRRRDHASESALRTAGWQVYVIW